MFIIKCLLVCFLSFVVVSSADDTSFITPCKPDDKPCLVSSAQAAVSHFVPGSPALGIPAADPLNIDSIISDENNLKMSMKNTQVTGISKFKILDLVRDTDKQTVKIVIETPFVVTGVYNVIGKILFLQVVGNGDFSFKTDKVVITAELKYKIIEKDGNKYWKITGFDYTYDMVEKIYIKLDNLFDGNEVAAKPVHELLDTHWKEIAGTIGDPIIKKVLEAYVNIVKKYLMSIPVNKLEIV